MKYTQPSANIRGKLREQYGHSADSLTPASQVAAVHFQTVTAANHYWKQAAELLQAA